MQNPFETLEKTELEYGASGKRKRRPHLDF